MSTAIEIAEAFLDLKRTMRQQLDAAFQDSGLSFARVKVLGLLERLGPCQPSVLAKHLRHAPRTLTDAIDALERDGWVRRAPHPQDRRAILVYLTDTGREAIKLAHVPRQQALEAVFAPLDIHEQEQLLGLLKKIQAAH